MHFDVACEAHQFQSDFCHFCERHREITWLPALDHGPRRAVAVLHSAKLPVHFLKATPESHHFRVRIGGKVPHHLELHLGGHDLALQPRCCLDRATSLLLEHDRAVPLLEAAEVLLSRIESCPSASELLGEKPPLVSGFATAKLRDKPV